MHTHVYSPSFSKNSLMTRLLSTCASMLLLLGVSAQGTQPCSSNISGKDCLSLNTITTAVPFLMISPDSRAGGMGDAGVAVSPDVNAIHWNPSKLAFVEDEFQFDISYSPWLRNLVNDMNLAYLALYYRLPNKKSTIAGSLRYFSLGSITFTDINGGVIRDLTPKEFSVDVAFAQQFSDVFSGGIAIRYINSNLTGGTSVQGAASKAGQSVAADVSFFYRKQDLQLGEKDGEFSFGFNVSNIGAKMRYTETSETDFIPINLRLGPCLKVDMDEYNSIAFNIDINKLLVPTPPIYGDSLDDDGNREIVSGQDPNVGVATGMFGSFTDAPGQVTKDEDGNITVEPGSRTSEEFREVNLAGGFEYWYAKQFAFRGGYFWEHATKGNRKYFTLGAGLRYNVFAIDLSYLIASSQQSPLANTLRFTLGFHFNSLKAKKKED